MYRVSGTFSVRTLLAEEATLHLARTSFAVLVCARFTIGPFDGA
jgi:hypothetical protein